MLPKALYNFFWNKGLVNEVSKAPLAKARRKVREAVREERYNWIFNM
jgi:hypothetical protein